MGYSQECGGAGLNAGSLQGMTISALKSLAANRGYSITKSKKADIIEEMLSQEDTNGT